MPQNVEEGCWQILGGYPESGSAFVGCTRWRFSGGPLRISWLCGGDSGRRSRSIKIEVLKVCA